MAIWEIIGTTPGDHSDVIGGVDAGVCDAPFKVTYPSEVDAFKARVLSVAESTDASVQACPNLPASERAAWVQFITTFRLFAKAPTPVFGSYGIWVETCGYAHVLDAWRVKIKSYCPLIGPDDISQGGAMDVLKWGATAVIAIATAAVLITYAPAVGRTLGAILPGKRGG